MLLLQEYKVCLSFFGSFRTKESSQKKRTACTLLKMMCEIYVLCLCLTGFCSL